MHKKGSSNIEPIRGENDMSGAVLSTSMLPTPIRERFSTPHITIRSHEKGVILMPFKDISTQRGIARGSSFTTSELLANRNDDIEIENNGQGV